MSEPLRRAVALIPGDARGNPPRLLRSELELASGATPIPAGDRQGTRRDLGDGVLRLAALRI